MFHLRLFGGLQLEGTHGGGAGHPSQRRPLALLAVLAVAGDRGVSRDRAAGLLWGDTDDKHALRSLSNALYAIRTEIGPDAVISSVTDLRLDTATVTSDVGAFLQAQARGDDAATVAAYGGKLLEGFHLLGAHAFEEWLDAERQRFATEFATALEQLARAATASGDLASALAHWRRLAAEDPYNSRVAMELARALAREGDPGNALQSLQAHVHSLRAELDAEPSTEVLRFMEQLRSGVVGAEVVPAAPVASTGARPAPPLAEPMPASAAPSVAPPRRARSALWLTGSATLALAVLALGSWGAPRLARSLWGPRIRSLAVLPLKNLTGDSSIGPYVDGVTEELTARLGRVAQLRVTSRTSATLYRNSRLNVAAIAGELGVDGILEGAVVRWGDRVRVTVQVIDARTDRHLGAETVERLWDSLSTVPGVLAGAVLASLRVAPTPDERSLVAQPAPRDPRMTALLAAGRWPEALARDSTDARAWAARSRALADSTWWRPQPATWRPAPYLRAAREAAERAMRLDSAESESQHALGAVLLLEFDYAGAERALRRAIALNPSNAVAHGDLGGLLVQVGRREEGLAASRLAVRLDPRSQDVWRYHLWNLLIARRWDEYETAAQEWLRIWPDQSGRSDLYGNSLMVARFCQGRLDEALRIVDSNVVMIADSAALRFDPMRAIILAKMGRRDEAVAIVRRAEQVTDTYLRRFWMAWAYAAIGELDRAVAAFRDAAAMGETGLDATLPTCLADPLRRDPRWPELLRLLNLTP